MKEKIERKIHFITEKFFFLIYNTYLCSVKNINDITAGAGTH